MKFNRIIVIGNNNIAVVTSNDENSTFEKINVKRALVLTARNINQGKNASTFISEKTGGSIKNCYVQGEMHSAGNDSGAIIGLSHGGITIENVVSNIIGRAYNADTAKTTGLFIGKINGKILKQLFKVVIDDTNYEISCVLQYVDYLKDQIKRLELMKRYYTKMTETTKEKTKAYYKEGIRLLLQTGETMENFEQVLEEYKSALIIRNKRIDDLYNEIKIIKRLKV